MHYPLSNPSELREKVRGSEGPIRQPGEHRDETGRQMHHQLPTHELAIAIKLIEKM